MDLKKINNSYVVIDKNINTVVNNYYTYIFSLLENILNDNKLQINIILGNHKCDFNNNYKTIRININYEHTIVKKTGRNVPTNTPEGKIKYSDNDNYLVRIDNFKTLNNSDIIIDYSNPNIHNVKICNLFNDFSFKHIYIAYDNDTPGREGAERLAKRIKTESRGVKVYINQWSEYLEEGYDIRDEFTKYKEDETYKFDELKSSIQTAIEYKLPSRGYDVIDTSDLTRSYNTPPEPIVEYLLYEGGVSLVAGTDGVGKTWFVLQMAYSIASGTEFLGFNVNKKDVLLIQFELSLEQLSNRVKAVQTNFPDDTRVNIARFDDNDMMFTDQWQKIRDTVEDVGLKNGVIIVDNIYTSTNQDLSDNNALQQILSMIQLIKTTTGNSIVLVGHHNKSSNHDEEPILSKGLIHGGKHLTNYVHNVFQIGDSTLGTDLRRGKITKVRDAHCELNGMAFKLNWNRDQVLFERGAVITNEKLHVMEAKKRWEMEVIISFYNYNNEKDFDRERLWQFVQADQGWMPTTNNYQTKLTRYIKTMLKWGFIIKNGHNSYGFNHTELKQYEHENK